MAQIRRLTGWSVLGATAALMTACHPVEHRNHVHFIGPRSGLMQVNARLTCPDRSGDLTRMSAAADGTSCIYGGPDEETVSLQLTPLAGSGPQEVLARLETQLKGDAGLTNLAPPAPSALSGAKATGRDVDDAAHDDDKDQRDSDSHESAQDERARDHTRIDLPGLHISASGDKADVQLPGISIHANGDNAQVHAGWWGRNATIEGRDGDATIRVGRVDRSGVDSMLIMTSDRPGPTGYRTVGYVAKGPSAGPLVIAAFKTKGDRRDQHGLAGDGLRKLVRLNVHQGMGWFSDAQAGAHEDPTP